MGSQPRQYLSGRSMSSVVSDSRNPSLTIAVPRDWAVRSPAIQDFLDDPDGSRMTRHIAETSILSRSLADENDGPKARSISNTGTSMMLSSAARTQGDTNPSLDLPALLRETSSRSSTDTQETPDIFDPVIPEHLRWEEGLDGGLETPRPAILECPFNFQQCFRAFATFDQWYAHSLTHFPQGTTPPTRTKCCFCLCAFQSPDGRACWRQLLEHVELHHQRGDKLAAVPPNLSLVEYLRNEKLITDFLYRLLKTRAGQPSGPFGQGSTENSAYDRENAPMFAGSVQSHSARRERPPVRQ